MNALLCQVELVRRHYPLTVDHPEMIVVIVFRWRVRDRRPNDGEASQ